MATPQELLKQRQAKAAATKKAPAKKAPVKKAAAAPKKAAAPVKKAAPAKKAAAPKPKKEVQPVDIHADAVDTVNNELLAHWEQYRAQGLKQVRVLKGGSFRLLFAKISFVVKELAVKDAEESLLELHISKLSEEDETTLVGTAEEAGLEARRVVRNETGTSHHAVVKPATLSQVDEIIAAWCENGGKVAVAAAAEEAEEPAAE